ncbi:hypothetical protein NL676_031362 [Syzygium grande]|nr:hypothetical protein NL676_031362 [Syzygium grande]
MSDYNTHACSVHARAPPRTTLSREKARRKSEHAGRWSGAGSRLAFALLLSIQPGRGREGRRRRTEGVRTGTGIAELGRRSFERLVLRCPSNRNPRLLFGLLRRGPDPALADLRVGTIVG